jgi:SsrA-binding protein
MLQLYLPRMDLKNNIRIKNRKARFEYEILDKYTAGIVLAGTEIKAIRLGKASIAEAFCEFKDGELWIINMTIQQYSHATHFNHAPKQPRKLLLNKRELKKLEKEVTNSGNTIIPLVMFITNRGFAKLDIGLAKGKKLYDKRETIKNRDNKKRLDQIKKAYNA